MTSSPSQDNSASSASDLTLQVHKQFTHFRTRHPRSSLIAVLETGPATNAAGNVEYIVRATLSLEGHEFVSSLAAAPTVETAEDQARLRCLTLAETITAGATAPQPSPAAINSSSVPPQSATDYGQDDGLGDTMINLGPLAERDVETNTGSEASSSSDRKPKPKPKPKTKAKKSAAATPAESTAGVSPSAPEAKEPATAASEQEVPETAAPPAQEFVADWSEDLAQIAVELKRLDWDSKQEQDYLQRAFQKSSRDDIIDHSELMAYLSHLQALPSTPEEPALEESSAEDAGPEEITSEEITSEDETEDNSPIADSGLSVDEADLAPQSVSELMASAGLKSGAEISAPPPAEPSASAETDPEEIEATSVPLDDDTIVREPEPEIEIADDEPEQPEDHPPAESLTRSEMMEETARLCKQLGWKNRQGSDFLKATYNKPTRKDLTDSEMMDFLEQLRSLSTTEALPY